MLLLFGVSINVGKFIRLFENPEDVSFESKLFTFYRDCVTFGWVNGEIVFAGNGDVTDEVELVFELPKGYMTHNKLAVMNSSNYDKLVAIGKTGLYKTDSYPMISSHPKEYQLRREAKLALKTPGRGWVAGDNVLISFWGDVVRVYPDWKTKVIEAATAITSYLNKPARKVWVQDDNFHDDEWHEFNDGGKFVRQTDPETAKKIAELSALLHTATPEDHKRISAQIIMLRSNSRNAAEAAEAAEKEAAERKAGWGASMAASQASKAGFDNAAAYNSKLRQESFVTSFRHTGDTSLRESR